MNKKRIKRKPLELPLPSDEKIQTLCRVLKKQLDQEELREKYAPVKHVLVLFGAGVVLGLSLIAPTAAILAKPFIDDQRRRQAEAWKRYNPYYLKRTIARMQKEKLVDIKEEKGLAVVTLTKGGKRRILKYALDQLSIDKPKAWDGRWRLILYDVDSRKKHFRDIFRTTLKSLGFFQLQESVWLYPYPCEAQVAFLREYYGVGNEVIYVVASKLEDDLPYRTFFGL